MTRVYVGNLPVGVMEHELEEEFSRFGGLKSLWVARKPPGFAFIEFTDERDADDAIKHLDGFRGWRVEYSRRGGGGSDGRDRHRGRSPNNGQFRHRRSPSYDNQRQRSVSKGRRRRGDRRRSPSYDRRRSPSNEKRRSPSYDRRRSRSYSRDRSVSKDKNRKSRDRSEYRERSRTRERSRSRGASQSPVRRSRERSYENDGGSKPCESPQNN